MEETSPQKYALKTLLEAMPKAERSRAIKKCRACVVEWRFKRDRYAKVDSAHEMRAIDALVYCEVLKVDISDLFGQRKDNEDTKKTVRNETNSS